RVMMVRYVFAEDQPNRLQVVTYRARDGHLTRRESVPSRDLNELESAWQTAVSDGDAADALVLQSEVTGMTMRIWQANAGWRTPPGPGETGVTPPTGLEVALQLRGRTTSMLKVFLLGTA
ncbi:MAG: type II secretory pathway component PulJ, partial [Janthinobacterium lividum]